MASLEVKHMSLWNQVCVTDPNSTKHVNQRGGFTAIDQMSQVQKATEIFGPCGTGWGYDYELIFPPNDTIIADVTLWHGSKEQTVRQCGQKSLGTTRVDEDAAKKAVTDGVTKCLSLLGFNADVFLGKFDDNKYVQQVTKEFAPKPQKVNQKVLTKLHDLIQELDDADDQAIIDSLIPRVNELVAELKIHPEQTNQLQRAYTGAKQRVINNDDSKPQPKGE
tara:strand:+ start:2213 stop:2875 length:663 start_codon:yes stop_codon:yes gene_type:complete